MNEIASIKEVVTRYLDGVQWHYTVDDEKNLIRTKVGLKGKLKHCDMAIQLRDKCFLVYAMVNVRADEACRAQVSEYLHRANFGLRWGNFEIDMRDGEIRYKVLVDCGDEQDCMPSESMIRRSIYFPASMLDKYGDGLLAVMYGIETPEVAANRIKNATT